MTFKFRKSIVTVLTTLALTGCGGSDDETSTPTANTPSAPALSDAKYMVYAVDGGGNVNVYTDDSGSHIGLIRSERPLNSKGGGLSLGEIHFNNIRSRAFVIVQSGYVDDSGNPTGGGLLILDTATGELIAQKSIPSAKTGKPSRLVHSYVHPTEDYLFINNDGPSGSTTPCDSATDAVQCRDSVFRVNIDPADTTDSDGPDSPVDDMFLDTVEILVDDGHKKGAFTFPSNAVAATKPFFVTHNLTARTVSVIDNDKTSPTFLSVVKTVNLGANNTPHGMGFSPLNGHVYTGIVPGIEHALSVLDAASPDLTVTHIAAGTGGAAANQIPAGGYVKALHSHNEADEGKLMFTVGYLGQLKDDAGVETRKAMGWLSVVDATTNTVADVIELGDIKASSFVTAGIDRDGGHHTLVFIGSSSGTTMNEHMAVVHIDNATGKQVVASHVDHVEIGAGLDHRNGAAAPGGEHIFMPAGGDCGNPAATPPVAAGPNCRAIAVYDSRTGGVKMLATASDKPGSIAVLQLRDTVANVSAPIAAASSAPASGDTTGGHVH